MKKQTILSMIAFIGAIVKAESMEAQSPTIANRMFEQTFESQKTYADPFNDVDVDVVFSKDGQTWRVPTFWRGGNEWTVRFAPPAPGEYSYRVESTDKTNLDLNGHEGRVKIQAYHGANALLRHGMIRVSSNRRYFEFSDGTPFYWLGDTWWTGLSSRLSWDGFQKLTADRKTKGFTVVQIVAGLVPTEEKAPSDPGNTNEGGSVWEPGFHRINPKFFDYADRRIQHLVDAEMVPAIVGAWRDHLREIGVDKMKKHWRYIIARYGAYPVLWIAGGEVFDPPADVAATSNLPVDLKTLGGWSDVTRYIRATDPLHHLVTMHERGFTDDLPLQDESLTDFQMLHPDHIGWNSIAVEVAQLNLHYSRTEMTKPLVVGEIGYEKMGETYLEEFQRIAFWLAMLNGAAGHTYGANGVWESYESTKPLQRNRHSFLTWEEGMNLPGSYQVGLGAKLLRRYQWWRFQPHPEWISPRGTTILEPRGGINRFHIDVSGDSGNPAGIRKWMVPSEWSKRNGNFRLPYAAGIPGEVRFVYLPTFGHVKRLPPTILGLEEGVRYHVYYWEAGLGIKIDLGEVERPPPGMMIYDGQFGGEAASQWTDQAGKSQIENGRLVASGRTVSILDGVSQTNLVASVHARSNTNAAVILRFHGMDNYLAAVYSNKEKAIYLLDRENGVDGAPLGRTSIPDLGPDIKLTAEVRGDWAVVSITDGGSTCTSEIVRVKNAIAGGSGLMHSDDGVAQSFGSFQLRSSPEPVTDEHLERKLYDAEGRYRGNLERPGSEEYGKQKRLLLDAYLPERPPVSGDLVLVLERSSKGEKRKLFHDIGDTFQADP